MSRHPAAPLHPRQGLIRSIGVSNFGPAHLRKLAETATIKPAVNQIELHPWLQARWGRSACAHALPPRPGEEVGGNPSMDANKAMRLLIGMGTDSQQSDAH